MPNDIVNLFEIKVPQELRDFRLDPKGRGAVVYTVHNVTGRTVIARAQLDGTDPLVAQRSVMLLNEKSVKVNQVDQEIKGNGEQTFKLSIEMPESAKPQKYAVPKLKFCDATTPDIKDIAPAVSFEMPEVKLDPPKRWIWGLVAVVAVVVIGVVLWLVLRKETVPVPDVADLLLPQAENTLRAKKLNMQIYAPQNIFKAVKDAKVDKSDPPKDQPVKQGDTVTLYLKVPVPNVATRTIALKDACKTLADGGLSCLPVQGLADNNPLVQAQAPTGGYLPVGAEVELTLPGPTPPPPLECHNLPPAVCARMTWEKNVEKYGVVGLSKYVKAPSPPVRP